MGEIAFSVATADEPPPPPPQIIPEFTIAEDIASANSNTTRPGRPGMAFDGTNYLVVSCRDIGAPTGIFGVIVSPDSIVLDTFHIATANCGFFPNPRVAFDGTNYLVVFKRSNGPGPIIGVRVTPFGEVLDGPIGFEITSVGARRPDIEFDGENYLVVWSKFISSFTEDILGARVNPAGEILDETPITIASGQLGTPTIAFDGVNYLVAWVGGGIFGARVTPDGLVIDPIGISISTAPNSQSDPAVTFSAGNYLVTWTDTRNSCCSIFGTRVTPDGDLLDGDSTTGGIPISPLFPSFNERAFNARVGFDGQNYFVVWEVTGFNPPAGIYAARVNTDGDLVDASEILISEAPCFPCRLVFPIIHSSIQTSLVAWINNAEQSGTAKDVLGAIVLSEGPFALIANLIDFVIEQEFKQGVENPLLSKLDAALNVFGNGNINATATILADLINLVEKKRGKGISDLQADELIAAAEEIIALLQPA